MKQLVVLISAILGANLLVSVAFAENVTGCNFSNATSMACAPPGAKRISHVVPGVVSINGKGVNVRVYEGAFTDDGADGGSMQQGDASRQFAFAFLETAKNHYDRIPLQSFFDDGGSNTDIVAVFGANVDSDASHELCILSKWDSSSAGGHSAMSVVGMNYEVVAFKLVSGHAQRVQNDNLNSLRACDACQINNDDGSDSGQKTPAALKTVAQIRAALAAKGLAQ